MKYGEEASCLESQRFCPYIGLCDRSGCRNRAQNGTSENRSESLENRIESYGNAEEAV